MNLIIYDFDNTLAYTNTHILVYHSCGGVSKIHNKDFITYKHQDGDKYDFSEFDTICHNTSLILEHMTHLHRDLTNFFRHPDYFVCILTARNKSIPLIDFLNMIGIRIEFPIFAVEGSKNKFRWIKDFVSNNKTKSIKHYDDDEGLLEEVRELAKNLNIEFRGILVK